MTDVNSTTTRTFPPSFELVSIAVGQVYVAQSVYSSMQKEMFTKIGAGSFAVACYSKRDKRASGDLSKRTASENSSLQYDTHF